MEKLQQTAAGSTPDALAQAVYAQSQALTSLVNQIASTQSDPLVELGAGALGGNPWFVRTGKTATRVGITERSVLWVGPSSNVEEDVTDCASR